MYHKIILKSGRTRSVKRFHPWIFSGAINKVPDGLKEGDIVEVFDDQGDFLAIGHYQPASTIAIKIFSFDKCKPDYNFWSEKISRAYHLRKIIGLANSEKTNAYRLINAEGDDFPGLIIDYYNGTAVLQAHTVGMYNIKDIIAEALKSVLGKNLTAIFDKSSETLPFKAGIDACNSYLYGKHEPCIITENGIKFYINWEEGQKTGFYIDQRENRKLLEHYSAGRQVLNLFGYTGGFSVYALRGGAAFVHTVDSSKNAIELANINVKYNFQQSDNHEAYIADGFEYLNNIKDKYDLIILDPPAFAKHNDSAYNAILGYKRLNYTAIKNICKNGILFTFSCSQAISREEFRKTVFVAAANTGRNIKILHQLAQPQDHPVSIYHPEGEYLKGLMLLVE